MYELIIKKNEDISTFVNFLYGLFILLRIENIF